jgi:hypothetical protein
MIECDFTESEREVAKAAEVYERTLQLVFDRVRHSGDAIGDVTTKNFTYLDIISPGLEYNRIFNMRIYGTLILLKLLHLFHFVRFRTPL